MRGCRSECRGAEGKLFGCNKDLDHTVSHDAANRFRPKLKYCSKHLKQSQQNTGQQKQECATQTYSLHWSALERRQNHTNQKKNHTKSVKKKDCIADFRSPRLVM